MSSLREEVSCRQMAKTGQAGPAGRELAEQMSERNTNDAHHVTIRVIWRAFLTSCLWDNRIAPVVLTACGCRLTSSFIFGVFEFVGLVHFVA